MKLLLTTIGLGSVSGFIFYRYLSTQKDQALRGLLRWTDFKLQETTKLTDDSKKYTFQFADPNFVSGLETGSFIVARVPTPQGTVYRPYTPISLTNAKGYFELAVKTYQNGKASQQFDKLKVGDTISFMGPIRSYKYKPNESKNIALIGGGAGITPLYQLLNEIAQDPTDNSKVDLFYGSKEEDGIMLKEEIDTIVKQNSERFKVHYFVSRPTDKWDGLTGHVSKEYLSQHLSTEDTKVFVCGPPSMLKSLCGEKPNPILQGSYSGILKELGFQKQNVFKF